MVEMMKQGDIAVEICLSQRGEFLDAAYFQFTSNPVARTKEVVKGILLVDLDSNGELVGLELLGPIDLEQLRKAVHDQDSIEVLWKVLAQRAPEFTKAA